MISLCFPPSLPSFTQSTRDTMDPALPSSVSQDQKTNPRLTHTSQSPAAPFSHYEATGTGARAGAGTGAGTAGTLSTEGADTGAGTSPARPRSTIKSTKALLTKALLEAKIAVQMDNECDIAGAIESYTKAVGLLSKVIEAIPSAEERERLKTIVSVIRRRAQRGIIARRDCRVAC